MPIQSKQQPPYYSPENIQPVATTLLKTITLTDAQIKTLPTTPIELIPSPGINKYIKYAGSVIKLDVTAGIYTNINTPSMNLERPGQTPLTVDISGAYLEDNSNVWIYQDTTVNDDGTPVNINELENLGIQISSQNTGNLTGGNQANTMQITILYNIINI